MVSRVAEVPHCVFIFGSNFGRIESPKNPQQPGSLSPKLMEFLPPPPSSSSSSSSSQTCDRNPMKRKTTHVSTEQKCARKISRMRIQSREEIEEERCKGVSTGLTLFTNPWKIKKELTLSDLNGLSRLLLPTNLVEGHILEYLPVNDINTVMHVPAGLSVSVLDQDTGTSHQLRLKFWESSKSYVLIGGWRKQFVLRRQLKEHDEIGLFWNQCASQFHFCVLRRAAANPN